MSGLLMTDLAADTPIPGIEVPFTWQFSLLLCAGAVQP